MGTSLIFTLLGFLARLLPHPPNMVPITALAIFAGARAKSRWSIFLPVLAMLASDFFIGFYDPRLMAVVYGSFIIIGLLGLWARSGFSPTKILGATFLGSVFFYLATNFAVWAFSPWYPKTLYGLSLSYTLALPFFRNSLAGDIFYAAFFFGAYEFIKRRSFSRIFQKIDPLLNNLLHPRNFSGYHLSKTKIHPHKNLCLKN